MEKRQNSWSLQGEEFRLQGGASSFSTRSLSVATDQMNNQRPGILFSVLSSCSLANIPRIEMFVSEYRCANIPTFVLG